MLGVKDEVVVEKAQDKDDFVHLAVVGLEARTSSCICITCTALPRQAWPTLAI
jgi:hypothetical protein